MFGQEYNRRAYATAASDMLMKQVDHNGATDNIRFGDSFTEDLFGNDTFDYLLTNPPFGVDWKKQRDEVRREHEQLGFAGRFGAGLPRISDGSLLFLQHMVAKFEPVRPDKHNHGSRHGHRVLWIATLHGRCGLRREQDSPMDHRERLAWRQSSPYPSRCSTTPGSAPMSGSSPIANMGGARERSNSSTRGTVGRPEASEDTKRSLGDKRRHLSAGQIAESRQALRTIQGRPTLQDLRQQPTSATRVSPIERPLRLRYQMTTKDKARFLDACPHLLDDIQAIDEALGREPLGDWNSVWEDVQALLHARKSKWKKPEQKLFRDVFTKTDPKAKPVAKGGSAKGYFPDPTLRDFENVPLQGDIDTYFEQEVRPHLPNAWMDRTKDRIGYEVSFHRHFYTYTPPRSLEAIDADLRKAEHKILRLLREVTE